MIIIFDCEVFTFQAQIHLLGNPVIWFTASGGIIVYMLMCAFFILRRRRACCDLPEGDLLSQNLLMYTDAQLFDLCIRIFIHSSNLLRSRCMTSSS